VKIVFNLIFKRNEKATVSLLDNNMHFCLNTICGIAEDVAQKQQVYAKCCSGIPAESFLRSQ
jgi:hypothetical protein